MLLRWGSGWLATTLAGKWSKPSAVSNLVTNQLQCITISDHVRLSCRGRYWWRSFLTHVCGGHRLYGDFQRCSAQACGKETTAQFPRTTSTSTGKHSTNFTIIQKWMLFIVRYVHAIITSYSFLRILIAPPLWNSHHQNLIPLRTVNAGW